MTTRDFIARTYSTESTKERRCSSVFTDYHGWVYSYGYHYPLAFQVAGLDFVNVTGYSSTTAKHINWAQSAIGYGNYIGVELWREDSQKLIHGTENDRLDVILGALNRSLVRLREEMGGKKRHDTSIYKDLENQEVRLIQSILKVKAVI